MKTVLAVAFALASVLVTPSARAVDCVSCAKEYTQLLNKAELISQTANQADQLRQLIESYGVQYQQLQNALAMARQIASGDINALLSQLPADAQKYVRTYQQLSNLATSGADAATTLKGIVGAAKTLGILPEEYTKQMAKAAETRGGYYRDAVQQDVATMRAFETDAAVVQRYAGDISKVSSVVGGLQFNATGLSMIVSELQKLRASYVQGAMEGHDDKAREAENEALVAEETKRYIGAQRASSARNREFFGGAK